MSVSIDTEVGPTSIFAIMECPDALLLESLVGFHDHHTGASAVSDAQRASGR